MQKRVMRLVPIFVNIESFVNNSLNFDFLGNKHCVQTDQSLYIKAMSGKYHWMKTNACVITWMYHYKWLCNGCANLLQLETLQQASDYGRAKIKEEKSSNRKFSETMFDYNALQGKMRKNLDVPYGKKTQSKANINEILYLLYHILLLENIDKGIYLLYVRTIDF